MQTNSTGKFVRSSGGSFWGKKKASEPSANASANETDVTPRSEKDADAPRSNETAHNDVDQAPRARHLAPSTNKATDAAKDEAPQTKAQTKADTGAKPKPAHAPKHAATPKDERWDEPDGELELVREEEPAKGSESTPEAQPIEPSAAQQDDSPKSSAESIRTEDTGDEARQDADAETERGESPQSDSEDEPLSEAEAEAEPEPDSTPEPEAEPEAEPEPNATPEPEAVTEPEAEPEPNATPEPEAATEPEAAPTQTDEPQVEEAPSSEAAPEDDAEPLPREAAEPKPQKGTARRPPTNAKPPKVPEKKPDDQPATTTEPAASTPVTKPKPSGTRKPLGGARRPLGKKAPAKAAKPKKKKVKKERKPPKLPHFLEDSPAAQKLLALWINHRALTITVTVAIVVLLTTYIAGGVYFSSHFLPHTTVNGNDVSLMSDAAFEERIANEAGGYQASVTGDGVSLSISGTDADLKLDASNYVKAAASQVPSWLWPFAMFSEQTYRVDSGVSLDEAKLRQLLSAQIATVNSNPTPPTNATIAYDEDTGDFVAVKEKLGTEIDEDAAIAKVATGMEGLNGTITLGDAELVQPTVAVENAKFKEALNKARNFPELSIDLTLAGDVVATLDSDLVRTWLVVDGNFEVTGDLDAITYYTLNTLSPKLDSVSGYRTYTRPDGKTININDGTYGWNINSAELAKVIASRIENQSSKSIEIPCNTKAAKYNPGGADWGNRYIDVDLTEQFARMYDDNGSLIWQSECVSGGPAEGNDTVTGVFYIEDKTSPMKLIGLDSNGDGEPDYENDVTYWMPFWGGYGFHDATWRYTFGGEEYLYDGSHGCVNLPYPAAEQLYYSVEVGDPVVVHW